MSERLGKGTYGQVIKTPDSRAMKRFYDDSHESAFREITMLEFAKHDCVMPVLETNIEPGNMSIVMPIAIASLSDLMNSRYEYGEDFVNVVIRDTSSAVAHIHALGIIHRDIKPANILITDANKVVLSDFGLAKFEGESTCHTPRCGTPHYSAPEMKKCSYNQSSDLYSLGVTVFETIANNDADVCDSGMMRLLHDHNVGWAKIVKDLANLDPCKRKAPDTKIVTNVCAYPSEIQSEPPAGIENIIECLDISSRYYDSLTSLVTKWMAILPPGHLLETVVCAAACVSGHSTYELNPCIRVFERHVLDAIKDIRAIDPLKLYGCNVTNGAYVPRKSGECEFNCDESSDSSSSDESTSKLSGSSHSSSSSETSSSEDSDCSSEWSSPLVDWASILAIAKPDLLSLRSSLKAMQAQRNQCKEQVRS